MSREKKLSDAAFDAYCARRRISLSSRQKEIAIGLLGVMRAHDETARWFAQRGTGTSFVFAALEDFVKDAVA